MTEENFIELVNLYLDREISDGETEALRTELVQSLSVERSLMSAFRSSVRHAQLWGVLLKLQIPCKGFLCRVS